MVMVVHLTRAAGQPAAAVIAEHQATAQFVIDAADFTVCVPDIIPRCHAVFLRRGVTGLLWGLAAACQAALPA